VTPSRQTPLGPGGEFDRLRGVFARLGPRIGAVGDDAALITIDGARLALSCDLAVEGRHFRTEWLDAREIGWRACAAALSDLAAVAADPLGVLAAVGVPEGRDEAFLQDLMEGVSRAAASAGAELWGGDLVRAPQIVLDIAVIGRADRPVRRRGAMVGVGVWVTGMLGAPAAALGAWERGEPPSAWLRKRFAHPVPRIAEAWWLRERGATAMIDVSDGLVGDAGHLAAASSGRIEIDADSVPVHEAVAAGGQGAAVALAYALTGGEEYELLVTLPPSFGERESRSFRQRFDLPLTRVGTVQAGAGAVVLRDGKQLPITPGFSHF
jgi:thiamine-monophosphate kinase